MIMKNIRASYPFLMDFKYPAMGPYVGRPKNFRCVCVCVGVCVWVCVCVCVWKGVGVPFHFFLFFLGIF